MSFHTRLYTRGSFFWGKTVGYPLSKVSTGLFYRFLFVLVELNLRFLFPLSYDPRPPP